MMQDYIHAAYGVILSVEDAKKGFLIVLRGPGPLTPEESEQTALAERILKSKRHSEDEDALQGL